ASLVRVHADLSCVRLSRTPRFHARAVAMRSRPGRDRVRCFYLIQTARNTGRLAPPRSRESTNECQGHVPRGPRTDEKTGLQAGSWAGLPRAIFNEVPYHLSPHISAMSGLGATISNHVIARLGCGEIATRVQVAADNCQS